MYFFLIYFFLVVRDARGRLRIPCLEQRLHQPLGIPDRQGPAQLARQTVRGEPRTLQELLQGDRRQVRQRSLQGAEQAQENQAAAVGIIKFRSNFFRSTATAQQQQQQQQQQQKYSYS